MCPGQRPTVGRVMLLNESWLMGATYRIGADLHTLHTRWPTAPWDLPGHLPPRRPEGEHQRNQRNPLHLDRHIDSQHRRGMSTLRAVRQCLSLWRRLTITGFSAGPGPASVL